MKILVVEDEKHIRDVIVRYLIKEKYSVLTARNGLEAIKMCHSMKPDLIILDLMLPLITGEQVLEEIRQTSEIPIIILSSKVGFQDRIKGLENGADDYVIKPFSPKELMLRVEKLIKQKDRCLIKSGSIQLDINLEHCIIDDENVVLTHHEFLLLSFLMKNKGKIFTRDELITLIFGYDYSGFDRNIDSLIKKIRKKIMPNENIKTKYGKGYYFEES